MKRSLSSVFLLLVIGLMGCKNKPAALMDASSEGTKSGEKISGEVVVSGQEQAAQHIEVGTVEVASEPRTLSVPGRIALPDNAMWRVGVLTTGRIAVVSANLGDYVHKGQVLAKMHSHDVHEARADYQVALSNRLRMNAARDLAQREYDRSKRLYALKAASVEQVEMAHQDLLNAEAEARNVEIAVQRERTHLEDTLGIPADIPSNATGEENDLIPIVAPADGYVLQKSVTVGSTIDPNTDAFTIGNLGRLWMLASVGEKDLTLLRVGERATVTIPGSATAIPGTLTNLGQQFDPTTRKIEIRIEVPNEGNHLRPEMLAEASLPVGRSETALRVPQQAIQQVSGQDAVFLRVAEDRFLVRFVKTGHISGSMVEILEGLSADEQVVTQGSFIIKSELLRSTIGD
jgi:cobalt-zinc-cadmium efflux system membrane fusion protein